MIVVGAGPGRVHRRAGAGPGRQAGLPARAGPVPRLEEHVRRRGLRPHPRHAHPPVVGGGAGPALGHPPRHGGHDRDPVAHRRLPHHGVGRGALQRRPPPSGPTSTPGWPDKAVEAGAVLVTSHHGHRRCCATAPAGSPACAPTGPTATSPRRCVIACDGVNSFLAKEAGLYPHAVPENFTLGAKEVLALPREEIDKRFGLTRPRGRRLRDRRAAPRASPAAGSSTPTSTASPSASCSASPSWPRPRCGPRSSSPASSATRWWRRWVEGADLKEYSAHLIPEAGYDMMPELVTDGHARGRRRRGHVPGRGHLAGGRELRHRVGPGRGRGRARRAGHRRHRRRRAWPATATGSRPTSCWPTTASCAGHPSC